MLRLDGLRPSDRPGEGALGWRDAARPLLDAGHALGEPAILFRKVEDDEIEAQRALLISRSASAAAETPAAEAPAPDAPAYAPLLDEIAFDDFAKLDLRVGRVTAAEPHPKADRLLRLEVDLGFETRQVLSGIRAWFTPEDALGRSVVVVANLAPRSIRGLDSHGMILMAEDHDGALRFVGSDAEPGAPVR
jgi:methionyl-tRNA synthetase